MSAPRRFRRLPSWPGVIARWKEHLPLPRGARAITLLEGGTPLVPAPAVSRRVGAEVFLKCEGLNPTGSFKDRGMTVAMTAAAAEGARVVLCASTGNTAASAAAYAARAGVACAVVIPRGNVAAGKLAQAVAHGARVLGVRGNFDAALRLVREVAARHPIALVNSVNPWRIEGQKTAAFEVCEALGGRAPEFHALPVGNAGNITAYWKGYREGRASGLSRGLPRMLGFQAAGSAPIVKGRPVAHPETVATAIRIGNPASWGGAVAAAKESKGSISAVSDPEILAAYRFLADHEGVFAEPASAAPVAGILKLARRGFFRGRSRARIVCTLTGHGLKDPARATAIGVRPRAIPADEESLLAALGLPSRFFPVRPVRP